MVSKKRSRSYATFYAHLSIVLGVAWFVSGCVSTQGIPAERYTRAEELVDQGTQFLRERQLEKAHQAYELAAELAPLAAAVDGLGCVAILRGEFDVAERFFWQAYEMDGTYDSALANLGLLRELQGDKEGARSMYLKFLTKNPDIAAVRNNLAALEYDQGRGRMETVHELSKAITLSNQSVIKDNLATLKGN